MSGWLTKARLVQLILFGANGICTGIVYSLAVWSLIAISPTTLVLDVVIAYATATTVNYLGARLVFKPETSVRGHALRYLSLIAANFVATAGLAWWLDRTGADNIISVYLPVAVTSIPTFMLMRSWVFKNKTVY